jgi:hypothetical protein
MPSPSKLGDATSPNRQTRADLAAQSTGLVNKVLADPSVFPDTFTAWLPRWIMQNVNFKVSAAQLPQLESVKVIGASGQPAFQNSWVAFGTSDATPGFYKDPFGIVHITGTVKLGTVGTTIFTLPAGYRPEKNTNVPEVCNNAFGSIQIAPSGAVTQVAGGSNVYLTLEAHFRAFS